MDFLDQFTIVDTPEKLSRLFQLRTILENLVGRKVADFTDSENFTHLGLAYQLPHELVKNQAKLQQIIDAINLRLEEWQQHYSKDIDKIISQEPNLYDDFYGGIYSILGQIYLSNPYNVVKTEQKYNLPITGDRVKLMHNWNGKYYGVKCLTYVDPETCLKKAIEYNDVENFTKLYPVLRDDLFINELMDLINLAVEYSRVVIFSILFKDYIENNDNSLRDLEGYDFIKKVTSLDIFKIIYSYTDMLPTIPIALDAVAQRGDRDIFEYLISIAQPTPNNLFNIAGGAKLNGWNNLTELALKQLRQKVSEDQYNNYFNYIQTV